MDLPSHAEKGDMPAAAMLETFTKIEPLISFIAFDKMESYLSPLGFWVDKKMYPPDIYAPYQTAADEDYHLKGSKYFGMVEAKPKWYLSPTLFWEVLNDMHKSVQRAEI